MNKKSKNEYCLYRGDIFVDVGTIKEIAERQGMNEHTIRTYMSEKRQRRNPNGLTLYKLVDDAGV
jgi:predicted transcriptional regulator